MVVPVSQSQQWKNPDEMELDEVRCQPVADWLMCKVKGYWKHLLFQLGWKSLVVAN